MSITSSAACVCSEFGFRFGSSTWCRMWPSKSSVIRLPSFVEVPLNEGGYKLFRNKLDEPSEVLALFHGRDKPIEALFGSSCCNQAWVLKKSLRLAVRNSAEAC